MTDEEQIHILLDICSVWNLPENNFGKPDPYINVYYAGTGEPLHKTGSLPSTNKPIWTVLSKSLVLIRTTEEKLRVVNEKKNKDGLRFEIKDNEVVGKNIFMGDVYISAEEILNSLDGSHKTFKVQVNHKANLRNSTLTEKLLSLGSDKKDLVPILDVQFRKATEEDEAFMSLYEAGTYAPKSNIHDYVYRESYISSMFSELKNAATKATKYKYGNKLYKVLPAPDPEDVENTKYMTKDEIREVATKPSKVWIDAGSGTLGYIFVEVIGCDELKNKDKKIGKKSDPFVCMTFEDTAVVTDVIDQTLCPRWMPWSRRAFAFRCSHPHSILSLGVFDNDVKSSDFIGHTQLNLLKLCPCTEYLLTYDLVKQIKRYGIQKEDNISRGKITLRIRVEQSPKAFIRCLLPPSPFLVKANKRSTNTIIKKTCEGSDPSSKYIFDQDILFGCIEELSAQTSDLQKLLLAFKNVILWRGSMKVMIPTFRRIQNGENIPLLQRKDSDTNARSKISFNFWAPFNSLILFLWAVCLAENPYLIPSFTLFLIPWLLFASRQSFGKNPSPWEKPPPLREIILRAFGGKVSRSIESDENKEEVDAYVEEKCKLIKLWNDQLKKNQDRSQKECEFRKLTAEIPGQARVSAKANEFSINPLNGVLLPYQLLLCDIVDYLRAIKSLFAWQLPLCAFMLSFIGLLLSIGLALLSPLLPVIMLWMARFIAWVLLGPGMKLVDIFFVKPLENMSDEERSERNFYKSFVNAKKSLQTLWALQVHTKKMNDMLTYRFGEFTCLIPSFIKCKIDNTPLPQSTAKVADKVDFQLVVKRQKGNYLEGTMIHNEKNDQVKLGSIYNLLSSQKHIRAVDNLMKPLDDEDLNFNETLLILHLAGQKLKNVEGPFTKSDPYFEITSNFNTENISVYKSEVVKNNLSPHWNHASIEMMKLCNGDLDKNFRINVYDHESNDDDVLIGYIDLSVNRLIYSQVGDPTDVSEAFFLKKKNRIKNRGMLVVVSAQIIPLPKVDDQEFAVEGSQGFNMNKSMFVEDVKQASVTENSPRETFEGFEVQGKSDVVNQKNVAGILNLRIIGHKLKNVEEGFLAKSDPFFEVYAQDESNEFGKLIYRSESVQSSLNPKWQGFSVDLGTILGGDVLTPLLFFVYDHESSGKHTKIGILKTSVKELMTAVVSEESDTSRALHISEDDTYNISCGRLIVVEANLISSMAK